MRFLRLAASGALFLSALTAASAATTYTFDKNHTSIRFCWNHFGISRQCATFTDFDGELLFDEANPANSQINVTFKTDSIQTLVPVFNDHMKQEKLFDTQKFPTASFKSTKVEKLGDKNGKVTGDLTIKGITKPVTLDVTLNFSGDHPMSKKKVMGFGATTTLKRSEFNLGYAVPAVSDDISLDIQTEMGPKT